LRHIYFIASEKEYLGSIILKEPHQQAIYSNMIGMVEEQHHIFEGLWNRAIPIQDRITEIEEGREHEFYEVISDTKEHKKNKLN
jgi:hypothetical protein